MRTWILLLGCLLASASQAQSHREIWEWTDADGVKHYSDAPAPGARKVVIVGLPTESPSAVPPPATTSPAPRAAAGTNAVMYSILEIWSPDQDQTFFGSDTTVEVRVRSEPELATGDRLRTYLDGKQIGDENSYVHVVENLARGAHTVTSVIFNAQGGEKIRSAPVVFHIRQTAADNPRNQGPSLRPPPPAPAPGPGPAPGPKPPKSG